MPGGAFVVAHLRSHHVARVIYGAIVGLALVVALEAHPPAAASIAAIVITTAIVVGMAELYSDALGSRVRLQQRLDAGTRREVAISSAAVTAGAAFPAVFFVVAATGAIEVDTAFGLAKWSGLGLIGCYGFAAGRLGGATRGRSLLHALGVAALGAAVIAIKSLLH